jgi:hypothetical protein
MMDEWLYGELERLTDENKTLKGALEYWKLRWKAEWDDNHLCEWRKGLSRLGRIVWRTACGYAPEAQEQGECPHCGREIAVRAKGEEAMK